MNNNNNIIYLCLIGTLIGLVVLNFWNIEPQNKTVATVENGDFVKLTGYIQDIKFKKDEEGKKVIKYIKFRDNTGGDFKIIAFKKVNTELTNYVNSFNPPLKPGDEVEVIGTVTIYDGIYELILDNVNNFKLIKQNNIENNNNVNDIITNNYQNNNDNNNNNNNNNEKHIKTTIYSSKNSKTYHTNLNCPYGKKIKEENRIYYNSEEDAVITGHKKCKWCEKNE